MTDKKIGYITVHHVKKSRKEYTDSQTGEKIPVGSPYYWWKWRYYEKERSVNLPRLTDKYPHSLEKVFSELSQKLQDCVDDEEYNEELLEEARDFVDERNESIQNIEEHFQEGHVLERLREMVEEIEDQISTIESYEE